MDEARLQDGLARVTGIASPGYAVARLRQDASARAYYRITLEPPAEPRSLVLMDLGPEAGTPDEATGGPAPAELPFVNVQRHLAAGGLPVPRLYDYDEPAGQLLLEDLGDRTLEEAVPDAEPVARLALYEQAVRQLVALQAYTTRAVGDDCIAYARGFDIDLLRWELDHFREWILDARGVTLSDDERALLDESFDRLAEEIAAIPRIFVHRDFQSRNLMVLGGGELGILDFQDALLGPLPYDLVALLRDSYVVLTEDEVERLIARYLEAAAAAELPVDPATFREQFALVALQRKLKDAGRFVFIDRVKGNPGFLRFVPDSLGYVDWALRRTPGYGALGELLRARVEELPR